MDTYKLKHQSRGGKNRKANLGVVMARAAGKPPPPGKSGASAAHSGSSMAFSPNWIITPLATP